MECTLIYVCEHRAVYDSMYADFQRQFDDDEVVD